MLPQRPPGSYATPPAARKSGPIAHPQAQSFESLKARVLAKLEDRLEPTASKRMPVSLLRQSVRQHAEQIADQEVRGLSKPERDRLVDEVLAELLGYGPLEELFKEATVREIMVTGPHAVIARRDQGQWLPTNVRFRDEAHLRASLDKLASNADMVGGMIASENLFDLKLPNGFRVLGIIPPPALGQSPSVAFIRTDVIPVPQTPADVTPPSSRYLPPPSGSASVATNRPIPGSVTASPRPGSNAMLPPEPRASHAEGSDPLARHRNRIIERLISKLASLGVYDLQRVDVNEFRKVIAAYVTEYATAEKIYLSDTDQGRLQLEILTAMRR